MDESVQKHLTELDEASTQLLRAAEIIEERGHVQWWPGGDEGGVCMQRALHLAGAVVHATDARPRSEATNRLMSALGASQEWEICSFNNRHSAYECIALFRKVALTQ